VEHATLDLGIMPHDGHRAYLKKRKKEIFYVLGIVLGTGNTPVIQRLKVLFELNTHLF